MARNVMSLYVVGLLGGESEIVTWHLSRANAARVSHVLLQRGTS